MANEKLEEMRFLEARDNVSDEELIARMNAAPDMGGALLVAQSELVARSSDPHPGEAASDSPAS
jgi:hypothetical protein